MPCEENMPDRAEETAPSAPPKRIRRQVIGRRLGLQPYYQIAPSMADTLVLTAHTMIIGAWDGGICLAGRHLHWSRQP